jgi:hypothetical protein
MLAWWKIQLKIWFILRWYQFSILFSIDHNLTKNIRYIIICKNVFLLDNFQQNLKLQVIFWSKTQWCHLNFDYMILLVQHFEDHLSKRNKFFSFFRLKMKSLTIGRLSNLRCGSGRRCGKRSRWITTIKIMNWHIYLTIKLYFFMYNVQ